MHARKCSADNAMANIYTAVVSFCSHALRCKRDSDMGGSMSLAQYTPQQLPGTYRADLQTQLILQQADIQRQCMSRTT